MKIKDVKKIIYNFTKDSLSKTYPYLFKLNENKATNRIFWKNAKEEKPPKPFVRLRVIRNSKLYRRFNSHVENGKEITKEQWQLRVEFAVCTLASDNNLFKAEEQANEIIEFLEQLFTNNRETFDYLSSKNITVNELESSEIRDLSDFLYTNNEYLFCFEVPFEYENISERKLDYGKGIDVDIRVGNTDNSIKTEVINR